jgi:Reverse transcriptase (RNA-dependent DNA polymerase)
MFFSTLLSLCKIPQAFKSAIITPLYKGKGTKNMAGSYRPISNLPIIGKVFEKIVFFKLYNTVEKDLCEAQHGFRKGKSCQTATAKFSQGIYDGIDGRKMRVLAVFIDLRKAFDSVVHQKLILRLIDNFDVEPYMVKLLYNYLTHRVFKLKNGNYMSKNYNLKTGVPQGSSLGPLLFTIFLNNIGTVIDYNYILYADDLVIYISEENMNVAISKMNAQLNKLDVWCKENGLMINTDKTKYMIFHKSQDYDFKKCAVNERLCISDCEIEQVQTFKYLGVWFDSNCTFKDHYHHVDKKLTAALSKLYSIKRLLTKRVMIILMNAYVTSIVDYCNIVWAVQSNDMLNHLQDKINNFLVSYLLPA